MKYAVILLCAGKGKRLKKRADKAFIQIGNTPLFYYSYSTFSKLRYFSQIIIIARENYFPLIRRYAKDRRVIIVTGGSRRQDSVYRGLASIRDNIDYVFIHDGARPFIDVSTINKLRESANHFSAVTLAKKVDCALKKSKGMFIKSTIDRKGLWEAQTPQVFKRELILKAYEKIGSLNVYDDNQLIEMLGRKVRIIEGSSLNIKITYPEDLLLAEAILRIKHKSQVAGRRFQVI